LISGYRQMLRAGGGVCGLLRHCRHAVAGVARTFTGDRASKEYSGKQRKAGPHRSEGPDA
jgi:hypothetical protein